MAEDKNEKEVVWYKSWQTWLIFAAVVVFFVVLFIVLGTFGYKRIQKFEPAWYLNGEKVSSWSTDVKLIKKLEDLMPSDRYNVELTHTPDSSTINMYTLKWDKQTKNLIDSLK